MSATAPEAVSGSMNLRDVGGLPVGGATTRSGILFRSGNLFRIDDAGRDALRGMGLRRIIDLRDDDEVERLPSQLQGLDVEVLRMPLFLGSVASFFDNDISLAGLYDGIIDESADRVVEVVRGIVEDQPVLVHCTVGKDRTGVTVALTLAAAGVESDAIVADYARTETLLPDWRNEMVMNKLRPMHPDNVHLEDLVMRSPAPVMRDLLSRLTAEYGSPTDYLRAHGLADDEITELQRVLVVTD